MPFCGTLDPSQACGRSDCVANRRWVRLCLLSNAMGSNATGISLSTLDLTDLLNLYDHNLFVQAYRQTAVYWNPATRLSDLSIEELVFRNSPCNPPGRTSAGALARVGRSRPRPQSSAGQVLHLPYWGIRYTRVPCFQRA